jgi:hypothetical protein
MDGQPRAGEAPSAGIAAEAGPVVRLSSGPKVRVVNLSLLGSAAEAACPFWIGLATRGSKAPGRLMDQPDIGTLLTEAATTGVSEEGPLMLSDTLMVPPRYVFLMPRPGASAAERQAWTKNLTSSLAAWAPPEVGFYVAPAAMPSRDGLALLLEVLSDAIPHLPATNTFHLLTAGHGVNLVLNGLLKLKAKLEIPDVSLYVYH